MRQKSLSTNTKSIKTSVLWKLLCLTFSLTSIHAMAKEAKVLNYIPNCEAEVIDTVTVKRKLKRREAHKSKDIQLTKAIAELVRKANERDVEALIITKSLTNSTNSSYTKSIIEVSADFLQLCEDDKSLSKKLTKYNDEGLEQVMLSEGYRITQTIVLDDGVEKRLKPELKSNIVSSSGALYNLSLNSSPEQTRELLGTPSLVFTFNDANKVLAYGRGHWLYFVNDKLVKASTSKAATKPFTYELINQIPFDERFDNLVWSVDEIIKKGDKRQSDSQSEIEQNTNTSIKLHWSGYANKEQELVSFELFNEDSAHMSYGIAGDDSAENYDWVSNILTGTIETQELIEKSKGEIVVNDRTKRYVYDSKLFFDVKGKRLKQIVIGDLLYKTPNGNASSSWRFGDYYQGQTLSDAKAKTSRPVTETFDELQINYDDYALVLHSYDGEIYKLEVKVYAI